MNSMIASGLPWSEVEAMVDDAKILGDPVASTIEELKLRTNSMIVVLPCVVGGVCGSLLVPDATLQ